MLTFLLTASTVTLAGIGGLYYSFACAVMPGLRRADDATFVRAMQQVNVAIQNPWFALSFAGAFLALAATVTYAWLLGLNAALPATIALAFYSATVAITLCLNVPLNNRLDLDARPGMKATRGRPSKRAGPDGMSTGAGFRWLQFFPCASHGCDRSESDC